MKGDDRNGSLDYGDNFYGTGGICHLQVSNQEKIGKGD